MDNKDPKEVVIDEFIGQSIPICLYEIAHQEVKDLNEVLTFYFIMFILFRIFDILKPYPVNYYDKNLKKHRIQLFLVQDIWQILEQYLQL